MIVEAVVCRICKRALGVGVRLPALCWVRVPPAERAIMDDETLAADKRAHAGKSLIEVTVEVGDELQGEALLAAVAEAALRK